MFVSYLFYNYLLICYAVHLIDAAAGKSIFRLSGQSNMSGRGGVVNSTWDGYIPPESSPNTAILRLTANHLGTAAEPLHRDIDIAKVCGVGPGMAFANYLLRKDTAIGVVGLVPCAIGGTNISEWGSLQVDDAAGGGGGGRWRHHSCRGLLWYQGESDTFTLEDAEAYKSRLRRFFVDVRTDLRLPVLPIVQVALASESGPYTDMVRKAQLGMKLVNLKTVDAMGLSMQQPENLHLTTPSRSGVTWEDVNRCLPSSLSTIASPLMNKSSNKCNIRSCE